MRIKSFEKLFRLVREIDRAVKQAKEIRTGKSLLEGLEQSIDPNTDQCMSESVKVMLTEVKIWCEDLLQKLSERSGRVDVVVSEDQLRAAGMLKEIQTMLSSSKHGAEFDKALQQKTNEYIEFRKKLKTHSELAMVHKLAAESN